MLGTGIRYVRYRDRVWQQIVHQQQLHVDQVALGGGVVFVVNVGVGRHLVPGIKYLLK